MVLSEAKIASTRIHKHTYQQYTVEGSSQNISFHLMPSYQRKLHFSMVTPTDEKRYTHEKLHSTKKNQWSPNFFTAKRKKGTSLSKKKKTEPNHFQISSSLGRKKREHTCLTLDERLRPNSSFFLNKANKQISMMISWNPRIETQKKKNKKSVSQNQSQSFLPWQKKKKLHAHETKHPVAHHAPHQTGYGLWVSKLGFLQFRVVIHIQSLISNGLRWRERKLPLWHDSLDRCSSHPPTFENPTRFTEPSIDSSTTTCTQFSGTIITNQPQQEFSGHPPIYIKKYLKAKQEEFFGSSNISPYKNILSQKNPSKRNPNPSRSLKLL